MVGLSRLPETTDKNPGQVCCLGSRAPTLDLGVEFIKSRKFIIEGIIWITKF
jgi:hypothetical protein